MMGSTNKLSVPQSNATTLFVFINFRTYFFLFVTIQFCFMKVFICNKTLNQVANLFK